MNTANVKYRWKTMIATTRDNDFYYVAANFHERYNTGLSIYSLLGRVREIYYIHYSVVITFVFHNLFLFLSSVFRPSSR